MDMLEGKTVRLYGVTRTVSYLQGIERARKRRDAGIKAFELLDLLRQWLDFVMWFIINHPETSRSVRYDWFMKKKCPQGFSAEQQASHGLATKRVRDFADRYRAWVPFEWVVNVRFAGGRKERRDRRRFLDRVREGMPEISDLVREPVGEATGERPPWSPRRNLFPKGATREEQYADYRWVRDKVRECCDRVAYQAQEESPYGTFPLPVPLPAAATGEVQSKYPSSTKTKTYSIGNWSKPHSISHWAKVFSIDRKTMASWLHADQLRADQVGSKWRIDLNELPLADDTDPRP